MDKMNLATAVEHSNEIISLLFHSCMRIESTGAVRRKEAEVDFIEMIATPQIISENSFWDNHGDRQCEQIYEPDRLQARVDMLLKLEIFKKYDNESIRKRISEGSTYYRFEYKQMKVLLYSILPPSEWGFESLLRTGDESFVNFIVEESARKGLALIEGHLAKMGIPLSTPEEKDVFDALGLEWVEPQNRKHVLTKEKDIL